MAGVGRRRRCGDGGPDGECAFSIASYGAGLAGDGLPDGRLYRLHGSRTTQFRHLAELVDRHGDCHADSVSGRNAAKEGCGMRNAVLVLVSVVLSLLGFEAALRIAPNNYLRLYQNVTPDRSTINHRSVAQGLYVMEAGENLRNVGGCFDNASIRVNSQGFRGNEWRLAKTGGGGAGFGGS